MIKFEQMMLTQKIELNVGEECIKMTKDAGLASPGKKPKG